MTNLAFVAARHKHCVGADGTEVIGESSMLSAAAQLCRYAALLPRILRHILEVIPRCKLNHTTPATLIVQDDLFNQSRISTIIVVIITSNTQLVEAPED